MRLLILALAYKQIIVLLIVGLALRLWRLDELMTIGGDLGYDLIKIKQILSGNLTLLGSPIGRFADTVLYLGPFYYYLQAPFVAIFKLDPVGAMVPIIIARSSTTLLVFIVTKKLFGARAAILAAIASTISPYFLTSLGPPSQPYLIPAIVAAIVFLLLKNNWKNFALAGLLTGLTTSLHYLGLSLFLALVPYALYGADLQRLKVLASLLLGLLFSISPTILFELRNNFFLTKQIIAQFTSGAVIAQSQSILSQFAQAAYLLSGDILGVHLPAFLFFLIVVISAILAVKSSSNYKGQVIFLILVIVINFVAVGFYGAKVQSHYLAAVYVPLFILAGFLIAYTARFNRLFPVVLITIIAVAAIGKNDLSRTSGYTMPEDLTAKQIRQISKTISQDAQSETFNITSTLDGDSRAMPYRYLVDVYGAKPLDVVTYDRGDSLYVITRDPTSSVRQNSLFEIASFQPSSVSKSWNINGDIKLIKLTKVEKQPFRSHSERSEESRSFIESDSTQDDSSGVEKFVTIVNPVRSRDLWQDRSIENLKAQINSIKSRGLVSTWLLQYDTLDDIEVRETLKNSNGELGALLEVSEKWATDAGVSYKIGEGDYYRPDKIFLSGYEPSDREKLTKTYLKKFQKVFGQKPQVAGAWYVDARSQSILADVGVKALLVVADQYDTDAAASWGKYWSMPFYPSKYNSLEPAGSQSLKIPIVNLQWAQRHPIFGYGKGIGDSRHSFQANDYVNNGFDSEYFDQLLAIYMNQDRTDFMQITLGLEAGQEARAFFHQFTYQLDKVKNLKDRGELKVVTMGQFSNWYQDTYPGISPSHFLTHEESLPAGRQGFWYMSPKFRVFVTAENGQYQIKDLRYYQQTPQKDYFYADNNHFLDRKVSSQVEGLDGQTINLGNLKNPQIVENFDRLTLKTDNDTIQINTTGVMKNGQYQTKTTSEIPTFDFRLANFYAAVKVPAVNILQTIRFSNIEGQTVFGLKIGRETLIGLKGARPGLHKFPFQTLVKFKSPAAFLNKFQPWLN